jgi:hypothetical protein
MHLLRTRVNKPAYSPEHPLAIADSHKDHPFEGCANPHKTYTALVVGASDHRRGDALTDTSGGLSVGAMVGLACLVMGASFLVVARLVRTG